LKLLLLPPLLPLRLLLGKGKAVSAAATRARDAATTAAAAALQAVVQLGRGKG
jgi:hypothetical protein